MKQNINIAIQNLKLVFSNWKYLLTAFIISFLFYTLNVIIFDFSFFFYGYDNFDLIMGTLFSLNLILYFYETLRFHSFVTIIIISLLFGTLFTLILYKTRYADSVNSNSKKRGLLSFIGVFLGVLAPGCAACGVGLISLLGLGSAFLSFFPFHGMELSYLAIIFLGYTVYDLSKNLTTCKIKKSKKSK